MRSSHSGFTLIELLVTTGLVGILVCAAAPMATNWVYSSQTHTARTQLIEGYSLAKSLALQNPNLIAIPGAAAGLSVTTDGNTTTLLVCVGSAAAAGCVSNGANVKWSTTYSGLVATAINTVAVTTIAPLTLDIDNRGEPINSTNFILSRGGSTNNETGSLY
jgi:prepilin-type N-terminal cleavage/methylation domain-containing protein